MEDDKVTDFYELAKQRNRSDEAMRSIITFIICEVIFFLGYLIGKI